MLTALEKALLSEVDALIKLTDEFNSVFQKEDLTFTPNALRQYFNKVNMLAYNLNKIEEDLMADDQASATERWMKTVKPTLEHFNYDD